MRMIDLLGAASIAIAAAHTAGAATTAKNGSFEKGRFVDAGNGYMQVPNGSATITGWTVSTATGNIVWAKNTNVDNIIPAQGKFCLDLTGFGRTAVNGAVSQTIHVKPGITYALTLDAGTFNDAMPVVTVGGQGITLTAGTPFTVNGTSWTPLSGTFLAAKGSKTPLLQVANTTTGAQLVFIDNVTIKPQ